MRNRTYDEILAEEIGRIYDATREVYFSKTIAASIVGGRRRLEELVGRGKIDASKPSKRQNGQWLCRASDVLRNAYNPKFN